MLNLKENQIFISVYIYKSFIWTLSLFILISFGSEECLSNIIENQQIESVVLPKLELDKSSYDFGDIKPNSTNKAVFNLKNIGTEALVIKDVKKCCGAVVQLDKQEIAPGENGVLTVEYRNGTRTGTFKKTVGLTTNEPNNPQNILTITGTMIQTLKWEPERFEIASFRENAESPAITIKSLDDTPFSIKNFSSSCQCLSADFDPNYSASEVILKPEVVAEKIKDLTSKKGYVVIELDHPDYKTIRLNFSIIQSLQAAPSLILVFNAKVGEPIIKSIEIKDNQNQNSADTVEQIDSIVSENGAQIELLKTTLVEKNCKLDLEILPVNNGSSRDQIVIKMKDGRRLSVPIRIFYTSETLTSRAK